MRSKCGSCSCSDPGVAMQQWNRASPRTSLATNPPSCGVQAQCHCLQCHRHRYIGISWYQYQPSTIITDSAIQNSSIPVSTVCSIELLQELIFRCYSCFLVRGHFSKKNANSGRHNSTKITYSRKFTTKIPSTGCLVSISTIRINSVIPQACTLHTRNLHKVRMSRIDNTAIMLPGLSCSERITINYWVRWH